MYGNDKRRRRRRVIHNSSHTNEHCAIATIRSSLEIGDHIYIHMTTVVVVITNNIKVLNGSSSISNGNIGFPSPTNTTPLHFR